MGPLESSSILNEPPSPVQSGSPSSSQIKPLTLHLAVGSVSANTLLTAPLIISLQSLVKASHCFCDSVKGLSEGPFCSATRQ